LSLVEQAAPPFLPGGGFPACHASKGRQECPPPLKRTSGPPHLPKKPPPGPPFPPPPPPPPPPPARPNPPPPPPPPAAAPRAPPLGTEPIHDAQPVGRLRRALARLGGLQLHGQALPAAGLHRRPRGDPAGHRLGLAEEGNLPVLPPLRLLRCRRRCRARGAL